MDRIYAPASSSPSPSLVELQKIESQKADLRSNINLVGALLRDGSLNQSDNSYYNTALEDMHRELAQLQRGEGSATMGSAFSHQLPYLSAPQTNGYHDRADTPSRKRSLEPSAGGSGREAKRVSANPSPQTPGKKLVGARESRQALISRPGTPTTPGFGTPVPQQHYHHHQLQSQHYQSQHQPQHQQYTLPSRLNESSSHGSIGQQQQPNFFDLTVSDPPSPERYAQPDPFPELNSAFYDDSGRMRPGDAFVQEAMPYAELAEFLITPTPAGGGYVYQQQNQAPIQPLGFTGNVPYLPGPQIPHWAGGHESDGEDYGDFPLDVTEVDAIEKMLETIKDSSNEEREETPRIMQSTLKEYQKIGLRWLLKQEAGHTRGGILADEMGLGKTVSVPQTVTQALMVILTCP